MSFAFTQEKSPLLARKKQKYLMLLLGVLVIGIIFVVWWGFLRGEEEPSPFESLEGVSSILVFPKVKINWELLDSPQLEGLSIFEEVPPYEGEEMGRENPFMPY